MTTTQLEAMKAEFARAILNEQDESLLRKIAEIFSREKQARQQAAPCRYTLEELNERIDRSLESLRTGRTTTLDELRARHPRV